MSLKSFDTAKTDQQSVVGRKLKVPQSRCHLSKVVNGNMDIGEIKVLDHLNTLPNEWYDMNYVLNLTTRVPTARPLKNGMRTYITAVYSRNSDLWEGWNEFITKGRSGQSVLKRPHLKPFHERKVTGDTTHYYRYMDTPCSLWDDFGLPCSTFPLSDDVMNLWNHRADSNKPVNYHSLPMGCIDSFDTSTFKRGPNCLRPELQVANNGFLGNDVDALPFMAYQKYCMFYHSAMDLQKKFSWVTELPELFRLPRKATVNYTQTQYFDDWSMDTVLLESDGRVTAYTTADWIPPTGSTLLNDYYGSQFPNSSLVYDNSGTLSYNTMIYRDSNPNSLEMVVGADSITNTTYHANGFIPIDLLQKRYVKWRGDEFLNASPFADLVRGKMPTLKDLVPSDFDTGYLDSLPSSDITPLQFNHDSADSYPRAYFDSAADLSNASINMKMFVDSVANEHLDKVNMNTLRALSMLTQFVELNGHTDGTYNSIIDAQYNWNPEVHTGKPTYIGGAYADVTFNQLQQTGGSTQIGANLDYLGKRVSEGSCTVQANLGKFRSPDYGNILVVAYTVPDTNYDSSCSPEWKMLNQNQQYYPCLSESAPRGIKRSEMYASFDDTKDNEIIGYEEAWSFMRMRHNTVNGLLALGSRELFDSQMIMRRKYYGTNGYDLNTANIYCTPWTIDYSCFSDSNSPVFFADTGCFVDADRPIPYASAHNYI